MSYCCSLISFDFLITPFFFFFNDTATTEIYTLSLHDALPISKHFRIADHDPADCAGLSIDKSEAKAMLARSEEHTSELQSHVNLVCRLLLEKKKKKTEKKKNKQKKSDK